MPPVDSIARLIAEDMGALRNLCATKHPEDKVQLILSMLDGNPQVVDYVAKAGYYEGEEFVNIYSYINASQEKTIAITCHHDIANEESENCLDNNASVMNLINLHNKLMVEKQSLLYNILIAFVDAEETVDYDAAGVGHLVRNFNVDQLIDFELTASGNNIIMNTYGDFDLLDYPVYALPFNNAHAADYIASQFPDARCRGSACLVTVSDEDMNELDRSGFCNRFGQCHRISDTVDTWASIDDMDQFVNTVMSFLVAK